MKRYRICVIHNTHTDVGFTGTQEEIELQQYDYLRQVIDILESGKMPGFKWQCENSWQIDNFYEYAGEDEKTLLEKWIRAGSIGLSGNYLNMTELADASTLGYWVKHARSYADSINAKSLSAMSCDVDGYGNALPDLLSRNGYRYFLGSIHTHHGMYPLYHCPSCFIWEGAEHGRILTFITEHYNLGNELGICPHSMLSYNVHDKYSRALEQTFLRTDAETTEREELEVAQYRIRQYLLGLEQSGYPFDIVPILVSGAYTDNGAPNAEICKRIEKLNVLLKDAADITLTTLDGFFDKIENSGSEIPVYRGDFPDWWASGTGTLPNSVRLYKEAQRFMRLTEKLDPEGKFGDECLREEAMKKAILFAEHTWSYCATVFYPWSIQNKSVELKNAAYAADYHTAAMKNLLRVKAALGDKQPHVGREFTWTVMNPNGFELLAPVCLVIDAWEYVDGCKFDPAANALYDEMGTAIPSQVWMSPRGPAIETIVTFKANEKKILKLARKIAADTLIQHNALISTDGVRDMDCGSSTVTPSCIETPFFTVKTERGKGIVSLYDKTNGKELLMEGIPLFSGIHDITHTPEDNGPSRKLTRRSMGRSIVSFATERSVSCLTNAVITENGSVYALLELSYTLPGANRYKVRLKVYKNAPLLSAEIILGAEGGLDPENFYISLPFAAEGDTYIGKAGGPVRPGLDQLPGSCKAFYALQDGIIRNENMSDVLVTSGDIPLILFGLPEPEAVNVCDGNDNKLNESAMFAWAVNNYWETNFPSNIGGDYRFLLNIMTAKHASPEKQMSVIRALSEGAVILRK